MKKYFCQAINHRNLFEIRVGGVTQWTLDDPGLMFYHQVPGLKMTETLVAGHWFRKIGIQFLGQDHEGVV